MPVPKPNTDEPKDEFISRCISTLTKEDPERPKDQIAAICYDSWRDNSKNAKSLYQELSERFANIRNILVKTFGERGRIILDYTLVRLGVYDPKMQKFNFAALKGDMPLPFLKHDGDATIVGNLIFEETEFVKVDSINKTVEGYGNTLTADTYDDLWMPEAYMDSVENYNDIVYFMHHRDMRAGKILERKITELGWWVKSKPDEGFWPLFENGTLKGYSIGGWIKIWPDVVGGAYVAHKRFSLVVDDLSYVTRPANRLSYFNDVVLDEKEKQALMALVTNPNRPIKQKRGVGVSLSQDMTGAQSVADGTAHGAGSQQSMVAGKTNSQQEGKKNKNGEIKKMSENDNAEGKGTQEEELTYKQRAERAETPQEAAQIYEEMIRAEEREKAKAEWLLKFDQKEKQQQEAQQNALPAKVAQLEESINALTALMTDFKKSADERFEQIESTPARKVAEGPSETDKEIENIMSMLEETGDIGVVARKLDPAYRTGSGVKA